MTKATNIASNNHNYLSFVLFELFEVCVIKIIFIFFSSFTMRRASFFQGQDERVGTGRKQVEHTRLPLNFVGEKREPLANARERQTNALLCRARFKWASPFGGAIASHVVRLLRSSKTCAIQMGRPIQWRHSEPCRATTKILQNKTTSCWGIELDIPHWRADVPYQLSCWVLVIHKQHGHLRTKCSGRFFFDHFLEKCEQFFKMWIMFEIMIF